MLKTIDADTTVVRCDGENCTAELQALDFDDARLLAKEKGWKVLKSLDRWEHYCPDCRRSF